MGKAMCRINFWRTSRNKLFYAFYKSSVEFKVFTVPLKTLNSTEDLSTRSLKKKLRLLLVFSLLERFKKLGFF